MARTKLKDQEPSPRPFLPPCRVCGDQAAGYHYGVNTCEACKGFFHRSLRRYKEYTCRANRTSGYCEYKPGKRKSCQFCRYQRCLIAGMSKQAIKTGRYTYTKRMNDTRELKRLQSLQHHFYWDFPEPISPASFMRGASAEYNTEGNELNDHNFVHVDTATKEEFERLLRSEYNHESGVYLPDSSPPWSSKSIRFKSHHRPTSYMKSNSLYYNLEGTGRPLLPLSLEHMKASATDWETDSSASPLSESGTYFAANSRSARPNSSILFNSDNILSISKRSCQIPRDNLINVDCDRKRVKHSAICKPGRVEKIRDVQTYIHRHARNRYRYTTSTQQEYLTIESPETDDNTSDSDHSTSNYTCNNDETESVEVGSAFLELSSRDCESHKLSDSDFDLFPDISLNLNGQPPSSPSSFATDHLETPASDVVGQCSELTTPCSRSTHPSSGLSPAVAAFSLDSVHPQQCCHDLRVFPEPGPRNQIHNCAQEVMDKSVSHGQGLYKHCLDLSVDSRSCSQEPPLDQTFLTAPDSPSLDSVASSSKHLFDNDYLHTVAPTSALDSGVKDVQPFNISELYKDKDAVIAALMASYKVNVEDYSHIPKDEMFAQQKAHYEECQLKKQTFGDLGFLPEHEYDEIYSVTGIDVDNRRTVIRKFLTKMEKDVRHLVQFAKSIPGFSFLDINLQKELVKLAQTECCMLSHYRTVNLELGIMVGLTGEHWACYYELGADDVQSAIADYVLFSDKLQKMAPTREEEVLLKAIVVVSTDRDTSVNSPLAEAIRWQLVMCLIHSVEKNRQQPSLFLARYILVLTQSRTVIECLKDFLRKMKLRKYSSIEQNPLLWEICSWIVLEKRDEDPSQQQKTGHTEGPV